MDMLDPGLDPAASATAAAAASHDKGPEAEEGVELQEGGDGPGAEEQTAVAITSVQQAAFGDHNIQYQFRTETNGGQAVIQNPFSNGGSPAAEAVSGEARFAYFPASSVGDTTAVSVQTTDQSLQAGGQFYVMMTPQDVLQTGTQRTIAPRTHPYSPKIDGTRTPRDERRRAQHNEVERRRRDKINNWIVQLSKIIPDCNADNSKTGAVSAPDPQGLQRAWPPAFACRKSTCHGAWESSWGGGQWVVPALRLLVPSPPRVKEGSCPRPAITSGSCARPTSACRRPSRRPSGCRWTTNS
nr:upstream stimulatory factor 2 isoform X4 [Aotus nancymaae]